MGLVLQSFMVEVECIEKSIGTSISTDNHRCFPVEPDEGAFVEGLIEQDQLEEILIIQAGLVQESVVPDLDFLALCDTA